MRTVVTINRDPTYQVLNANPEGHNQYTNDRKSYHERALKHIRTPRMSYPATEEGDTMKAVMRGLRKKSKKSSRTSKRPNIAGKQSGLRLKAAYKLDREYSEKLGIPGERLGRIN